MKFIERKRQFVPAKTDFIKTKYLDLPYANRGERRKLDLYLPNEGEGPFPLIVDIFGGGWFFGNKSSYKLEPALNLLKRGFAVASVNYTLSCDHPWPVQIHEIKTAIRFLRSNSAKYGLDERRIALMGESAGAHLAAVAAISAAKGKEILNDLSLGWAEASEKVQAVIAVYCPANLGNFKQQCKVLGLEPECPESGEADSMEGVLFGRRKISEIPEVVKEADPSTYVCPQCPPFLFLHGDHDRCIPILQSMNLAVDIMKATSIDNVEYHIVKRAEHDLFAFETEEIYDWEADFLRRTPK